MGGYGRVERIIVQHAYPEGHAMKAIDNLQARSSMERQKNSRQLCASNFLWLAVPSHLSPHSQDQRITQDKGVDLTLLHF